MKLNFWINQLTSKSISFIIGGILIVAAGGYGSYYLYTKNYEKKLTPEPSPIVTTSTNPEPTTSSTPTVAKVVDTGVTWTIPAQKLADLGIIGSLNSEVYEYKETTYYKIGATATADIILARVRLEGMGDYYYYYRFLKTGNKYELIVNNSDEYDNDAKNLFTFKIDYTNNSTFILNSLIPDSTITMLNTRLNASSNSGRSIDFDTNIKGTKLSTTKWGDLYYRTDDTETAGLFVGTYYVLLNDSTKAIYTPSPTFFRDDNTFDVTWTGTSSAAVNYSLIRTGGCGLRGGVFPVATDKTALNAKELIATSSSNGKLYVIKDVNNSLVQFGYSVYTMDQEPNKLPISQFVADNGMIFWTDDLNNTLIYFNQKYNPNVECGKPVIYLYPEKDTPVSVKVGALVTKSEPNYKNGWQGIAHTDGTITVNNKLYPNLFWEGLGIGEYPQVKNGKIVPSVDVKKTIINDLTSMSLNEREINDFLEFWMPKMPASKFVRLTWFTNKDLNILAPLRVSPSPKSIIRVFLDFSGTDTKTDLPAQTLPKFNRTGYTLVEWGGLLKGSK